MPTTALVSGVGACATKFFDPKSLTPLDTVS
jgi:hypothetical protein